MVQLTHLEHGERRTARYPETRRHEMRRMVTTGLWVLLTLLAVYSVQAAPAKIEYLNAQPLSKVVTPRLKSVEPGAKLVYVITWGGDVGLVYGVQEGLFREAGLD